MFLSVISVVETPFEFKFLFICMFFILLVYISLFKSGFLFPLILVFQKFDCDILVWISLGLSLPSFLNLQVYVFYQMWELSSHYLSIFFSPSFFLSCSLSGTPTTGQMLCYSPTSPRGPVPPLPFFFPSLVSVVQIE